MKDGVFSEDWEKNIVERVAEHSHSTEALVKRRKKDNTQWGAYVRTRVTREFSLLMHRAAEGRGISVGGYIKRSVAVMIARDLGLPLTEVLKHSPFPGPYLTHPYGSARGSGRNGPDDGSGYGSW